MPELPEVETVCAGLREHVAGLEIARVITHRPDLRVPFPADFQDRVGGKRIAAVRRRAKYILLCLDDRQIMAIHLGMSGRITISGAQEAYIPQLHDHMILEFTNGGRIVLNDARRFGMVVLFHEDDMDAQPAFRSLGPEPLGNEFSGPFLKEVLKGRVTPVKQAIMDQRIVVGVGNIYACEALFMAGISPKKKAKDITLPMAQRLVDCIRDVLSRAIEAGGSSLKDYRRINGELGYFQHSFSVYDRENQPCPDCDCDTQKTKGVRRIVQSGRSTFYCPVKQK